MQLSDTIIKEDNYGSNERNSDSGCRNRRCIAPHGAEVYRVEDTVLHILKAYEIADCDVYVLSNGIFASANENKEDACSMIRHVPLGSTHLGRIAALNQLSREICPMNVPCGMPGWFRRM